LLCFVQIYVHTVTRKLWVFFVRPCVRRFIPQYKGSQSLLPACRLAKRCIIRARITLAPQRMSISFTESTSKESYPLKHVWLSIRADTCAQASVQDNRNKSFSFDMVVSFGVLWCYVHQMGNKYSIGCSTNWSDDDIQTLCTDERRSLNAFRLPWLGRSAARTLNENTDILWRCK
jgi:hypothetical protein